MIRNVQPHFNGSGVQDMTFGKVYLEPAEGQTATVFNNEVMIRQVITENPQQGYEMIFRRYYQPLCSHAVRYLYSKEAAEDIVGEVFLNFWKNRLYENVTSTYRAYLYTAVRNNAFNHLKKELREKTTGENLSALMSRQKETADPHSILLLDELFTKVEKAVASFPPQCQKVFLMSRYEGKKNREIAEALQLKIKTVEAHMMKALALLKKSMQEYLA